MASFAACFAEQAGSALARQLALADLVGEQAWTIDVQAGVITFGEELRFSIQLLGSHAFAADTWLWIWANPQGNIPAANTGAAQHIRDWGQARGVAELVTPKLAMGPITDHQLAMVCGGVAGGLPYYRAPYDGGALFVLLEGVPAEVIGPVGGARAITVLGQLTAQFEVQDHRRMAESFLRQQGFRVDASPSLLTARRIGCDEIEVRFDALGRISHIGGALLPQPPAPPPSACASASTSQPPRWQFWKRRPKHA